MKKARHKTGDEIRLDRVLWRIYTSRDLTKGEVAARAYFRYCEAGRPQYGRHGVGIYSFLRLLFHQSHRYELTPYVEDVVADHFGEEARQQQPMFLLTA